MIDSYMRYGALAAKVKALYGKRLRFSDFEHMAGLPNEQSILDYLRTQPGWSAAVSAALSAMNTSGYVGRMELEDALRLQIWREYEGLNHFVPRPDKNLVAFPLRQAELLAILGTLRRLKSHGRVREGVLALPNLPFKVNRKALIACKDYNGLLAAVQGSIYYEPLLHIRPDNPDVLPDYTTTEALLRSTYFSHIYRIIYKSYSGETKSVLLKGMGERVDLLNIIHILRLKTYFPGDDQYYSALFPINYKLRPEKIKAMCDAADVSQVFAVLQDTPYAGRFTSLDVAGVEDCYRRSFYTFNKRLLVSGPPSIYTAVSYLNVKSTELKALVNVIESVKYGAHYDEDFVRLVGE